MLRPDHRCREIKASSSRCENEWSGRSRQFVFGQLWRHLEPSQSMQTWTCVLGPEQSIVCDLA
jgi:hypothetical protein